MRLISLKKSQKPGKKFDVVLADDSGKEHTVSFGAAGYSDYTIHKDPTRRERYLLRHKAREDWTRSGILTPGFWSRWLLWNLPTLEASLADVRRRFQL